MKYDKTTVIGVAACALLLLASFYYQKQNARTRFPAPGTVSQPPVPGDTTPATGGPDGSPTVEGPVTPAVVAPPVRRTPGAPRPLSDKNPLVLETEHLMARIDPDGGGIRGITLKDYLNDPIPGVPDTPVEMGRPEYPFLALDPESAGLPVRTGEVVAADRGRVTIRRTLEGGVSLEETWEAVPESAYRLRYSVTLVNDGAAAVDPTAIGLDAGAMPAATSPGRSGGRGGSEGGISIAAIGKSRPDTFTEKKIGKLNRNEQDRAELGARLVGWVAVHSQYFLLQVAADDAPFAGVSIAADHMDDGGSRDANPKSTFPLWYRARTGLPGDVVRPGETRTWAFSAYVGPKKYEMLRESGGRLEAVMNMDRFLFLYPSWMEFITRFLLKVLVALNGFFRSEWGYGYAIVVITVVVKVLFWPLTHYSTQSMRKMQKLQPQLKELREKYKDEPQKLMRKQRELFKENNVSQLGGCLPMLFQLPVFFALFNTFRSAIELRHSGFMWVADLSLPDTLSFSPAQLPIRPLALAMGLSMIGQQKLTPSGGDPQQQRMMMFMSVFFIFIFYGMPSGLTLYWTINQVLAIVQTLVTRHLENKKELAAAAAGEQTQKAPEGKKAAKTR